MNQFWNNLKQVKNIQLPPEQRTRLREHLFAYAQANPVRDAGFVRRMVAERSRLSLLFTNLRPMHIGFIVMLILALSGGGTALAAQNSLPGDALYPIKVGVTEELRSALALTAEGKAELAIDRVEKRIAELAELEARGQASAQAEGEGQAELERQNSRAQARVNELATRGRVEAAADLATKLETALRVHSWLQAHDDSARADTPASAGAATDTKLQAATKLRSDLEARWQKNDDADQAAAGESMTRAQVKVAAQLIASSEGYLEKHADRFTEQSITAAKSELTAATSLLAHAETKLAAGAYGEAFTSARQAQSLAHEVRLLLAVKIKTHHILPLLPIRSTADTGIGVKASGQMKGSARSDETEERSDVDGADNKNSDEDDKEEDRNPENAQDNLGNTAIDGGGRLHIELPF